MAWDCHIHHIPDTTVHGTAIGLLWWWCQSHGAYGYRSLHPSFCHGYRCSFTCCTSDRCETREASADQRSGTPLIVTVSSQTQTLHVLHIYLIGVVPEGSTDRQSYDSPMGVSYLNEVVITDYAWCLDPLHWLHMQATLLLPLDECKKCFSQGFRPSSSAHPTSSRGAS